MMIKYRKGIPSISRVVLVCSTILGLLAIQLVIVPQVFAQTTATPEPTETLFRFDNSKGYCGSNLTALQLTLQYKVIQVTRAVNSTLCGRLVIIHDKKTGKEYLGLVPCSQRGGPYIFETRPRELLNYYQFVNVKFKKGKMINSKEFGEINKYISSFQTYYPLEQCSKCGFVSKPVSPPDFSFPGQNPSETPAPPSAEIVGSANNWMKFGEGFSSSDLSFVFPTPTVHVPRTATPARSLPAPVALLAELTSTPTAQIVSEYLPDLASQSLSEVIPSPIPTGPKPNLSNENNKPPTDLPQRDTASYSIYTLILVPLMVLGIIWRRSRLR